MTPARVFLPLFVMAGAAVLWGGEARATSGDLSGDWEIQSMGSDRKVTVQQQGKKVVVHRVMWPEFEGERYKLEHLYRGTVAGTTIKGKLLVKEDGLPDWEVLRSFTGSIDSDAKVVLDGLPMRRVGQGSSIPTVIPADQGERESPPPAMSHALPRAPRGEAAEATTTTVAENQPTPRSTAPTEPAPASQGQDDNASLFANIMGQAGMGDLFQVSSRVTIPNPVADLTDEGDTLFDKGRYQSALAKYEEAVKISKTTQPELVHRIGRCHLKMKHYEKAASYLRRAMRLDPHNDRLRRDYEEAKNKV